MSKRASIASYFAPISPAKRVRLSPPRASNEQRESDGTGNVSERTQESNEALHEHALVNAASSSNHSTYPFPVPSLSPTLAEALASNVPVKPGRAINDKPLLDLLYYQPFLSPSDARHLFDFLRRELFFYRVRYTIKRGPEETWVSTPRYTSVFGVDATARFREDGQVVDAQTQQVLPPTSSSTLHTARYPDCRPRPIPAALDALRTATEAATGKRFNFCLVNYYASGADSISMHSDDERFLGSEPAIASFSLGAAREFVMKKKPDQKTQAASADTQQATGKDPEPKLSFTLASGDMLLMQGPTQANWLHGVPKRGTKGTTESSREANKGRINITFRYAVVPGGTRNYYRYNVGKDDAWKWDDAAREMRIWKPDRKS